MEAIGRVAGAPYTGVKTVASGLAGAVQGDPFKYMHLTPEGQKSGVGGDTLGALGLSAPSMHTESPYGIAKSAAEEYLPGTSEWEQEHPYLTKTADFAGELGSQIAFDPVLHGLTALGKAASSPEALAAVKATGVLGEAAPEALRAAQTTPLTFGARIGPEAAATAQRVGGAAFIPGMLAGGIQSGLGAYQGYQQGGMTPEVFGQGLQAAGDIGMAGFGAYHATRPQLPLDQALLKQGLDQLLAQGAIDQPQAAKTWEAAKPPKPTPPPGAAPPQQAAPGVTPEAAQQPGPEGATSVPPQPSEQTTAPAQPQEETAAPPQEEQGAAPAQAPTEGGGEPPPPSPEPPREPEPAVEAMAGPLVARATRVVPGGEGRSEEYPLGKEAILKRLGWDPAALDEESIEKILAEKIPKPLDFSTPTGGIPQNTADLEAKVTELGDKASSLKAQAYEVPQGPDRTALLRQAMLAESQLERVHWALAERWHDKNMLAASQGPATPVPGYTPGEGLTPEIQQQVRDLIGHRPPGEEEVESKEIKEFTELTNQLVKDNGVHLKSTPSGTLKWLNPTPEMGVREGKYHNVYLLGTATEGEYAGQDLVLRLGYTGGEVAQGPDIVPLISSHELSGGTIVDVVPFLHTARSIGLPTWEFQNVRSALGAKLRSNYPDMRVKDLEQNPGNVAFLPYPEGGDVLTQAKDNLARAKTPEERRAAKTDLQMAQQLTVVGEDGKFYRPVVSDFGVINPQNNITRSSISRKNYDSPKQATEAAQTVLATQAQASALAYDRAKAADPSAPPTDPLRKINRSLFDTSAETARGVVPLHEAVAKDFAERGLVSLRGLQINPYSPSADLATAAALNRAPYEVHQIVGIKDGQVVEHFAWTSAQANVVDLSHPELARQMSRLQEDPGVDAFYITHNHPAGLVRPSDDDLAVNNTYAHSYDKYQGSVIIDHGSFSFNKPGEPSPGGTRRSDVQVFSYAPSEPDPMFKNLWQRQDLSSLYAPTGTKEQVDGLNLLASLSKQTFGDPNVPRVFFLNDKAKVMGVSAVPIEALADQEFSLEYLTKAAARSGGGWPFLHFMPESLAEAKKFADLADDFTENKAIAGALIDGLDTLKGSAADRADLMHRANVGWGVDNPEGMTMGEIEPGVKIAAPARIPMQLAAERATPEEMEADKAKLQEQIGKQVLESAPPVRPPTSPGRLAGGAVAEPASEEYLGAKPGGTPDHGLNMAKDIPDISDAQKLQVAGEFNAIWDKLKRSKGFDIKSYDQALVDAQKLDPSLSPEEVLNKHKGRPFGMDLFALAHAVWREKDTQAEELRGAWQAAPENQAAKDAFIKAKSEALVYGKLFIDKKGEAGAILKSLDQAKMSKLDPELSFIGRFLSALRRQGVDKGNADALLKIYRTEPEKFQDALAAAIKPSWKAKLLEAWKAGLVSSPVTRVAKASSEILMRSLRDVEDMLAPGVDWARVKALGGDRERYLGESAVLGQAYKDAISGPDGALAKWMANRGGFTMKPVEHGVSGGAGALAQDLRLRGAIPGPLGEAWRIPFKRLETDADFMQHLSAAQAIYRDAYRQARQGGKVSHSDAMQTYGKTASEMLDVARLGPESEFFEKHSDAFENRIKPVMLRDTFQAPLEGLYQALSKARGDSLVANALLPFPKTSTNLVLEAWRRTPMGLIWGKGSIPTMLKAAREGKLSGQHAEELTKAMVGSTVATGLAMMAYNGFITGGLSPDKKIQDLYKQAGIQPYSVKIGNQYFNYQRLEPLAGVISTAADLAEGIRQGEFKDPNSAIKRIVGSIGEGFTNKTFLAGLSGFFTAWHDPIRYGGTLLRQLEGSVVPSIVGRAASAIDPLQRDSTQSLAGPILAKLPFASETLPEKVSNIGAAREKPGDTGAERFFSPFTRSTLKTDQASKVAQELAKVGYAPTPVRDNVIVKGVKVPLKPDEKKKLAEAEAEGAKAAWRIIQDPTYQRLPDLPTDQFGGKTKKDLLEKVFQRYHTAAMKGLSGDLYKRAQAQGAP